jgi:hypothetical protein
MPADKYGYHPTPDQWTYGKIVSHVIQANFGVCGMLSGDGPGKGPTVTDTTPKDQLVTILKQSFETCQKALDGLQDSSLGGTITYFRGAKKPRARALVELTDDLEVVVLAGDGGAHEVIQMGSAALAPVSFSPSDWRLS